METFQDYSGGKDVWSRIKGNLATDSVASLAQKNGSDVTCPLQNVHRIVVSESRRYGKPYLYLWPCLCLLCRSSFRLCYTHCLTTRIPSSCAKSKRPSSDNAEEEEESGGSQDICPRCFWKSCNLSFRFLLSNCLHRSTRDNTGQHGTTQVYIGQHGSIQVYISSIFLLRIF